MAGGTNTRSFAAPPRKQGFEPARQVKLATLEETAHISAVAREQAEH
jgi:uncharacterized membrane protein YcaP (DUF421 family)